MVTGPFLGVFIPAEEILCLLIHVCLWARASTHIRDREWLWWEGNRKTTEDGSRTVLKLEGRLRMQDVASGEQ